MLLEIPKEKQVFLYRERDGRLIETGMYYHNARVVIDDEPVQLRLGRRKVAAYRADARSGYNVHYFLGTEISPLLPHP